jgi:hypothetical protein
VVTAASFAAPAQAATDVAYSLEVVTQGTFAYEEYEKIGDYWNREEVALDFDYLGHLDQVVFRDGKLFEAKGRDLPEGTITGKVIQSGNAGARTCTGFDGASTQGWMRFAGQYRPDEDVVPLDGEEHVYLRPFDRYRGGWSCGGDWNFSWDLTAVDSIAGVEADGADDTKPGDNPFDVLFSLPPRRSVRATSSSSSPSRRSPARSARTASARTS